MFGCSQVELKLEFVAFQCKHDFYTEIYGSTHFYVDVIKHKPIYNQFTFK